MLIKSFVITGGMGTGKSTVLNFFKQKGYTIYDADKIVSDLFINNHESYKDIATLFDNWLGTDFVKRDKIDKAYVRPFLERIENGFPKSLEIVTPFVQKKMEELYLNSTSPIIFEVPLLFEAHMQNNFDKIILLTCDLETRIARISLRQPHLSREKILQTIASQQSEELKKPFVNYVIDNSYDLDYLNKQLETILLQVNEYYQQKSKLKP